MKKLIFQKLFKDILMLFIVLSLSLTVIVWVMQAVNFLDFVSEDGHGFKVYFSYTLLNFPKIFSRLLIITFFISIIYTIIRYEENNELILFWMLGISKIQFIKNIIKFSIFFLIIQILLTSLISPMSQDSARSFIRSSNIDLFPSLIKKKKFIDTVTNLTIYVDEISENKKTMENIFIKDQSGKKKKFQIILAKEGELINIKNKNYLILKNGEIFNSDGNKSNSFRFENFEFNLSNFVTKTTTIPKIQETESTSLVKCIINNTYNKNLKINPKKLICDKKSTKNISEELLKRFYLPLYMPLITLIGCLVILKTKEENSYRNHKILIFSLGFIIIFFSEASIKYVGENLINNLLLILIPLIIYLFMHLFLMKKLNYKIKE
ncbi:LptF/LptG family permease [Candidatus Pelagibacter sp. Uisw_113]|uniref:LptF/LptG family permease n=1 Tax=Candidatus Pelagibacter sp. Uisw_113 TaxID=3230994 RepID=UPI0039EC7BD8